MAGEFKYWGFISYSHKDTAVARSLQNAIESYRIPRRLVGLATPVGGLPEYLRPVFRDRDELPAGVDLTATVRAALAASRYLIVICSPDAARSQWVAREIEEFKRLHGEQRVLALIARGEPFASGISGREAEECFPEPLRLTLPEVAQAGRRPVEIVAADLRPHGDGKRLATLKILAGMMGAGNSVDELVRRDAQRRARRMAMLAAASVAGMAVMGVLTVTAFRARAEAQRQHAHAEDLLGFMLGDLRKKLEPIGHLDVLDAVGAQALAYYAQQDPNRLDGGSLGRRSAALHLIGEIREQRGRLDEALAAFTSAAATTEQSLARAPHDQQRIFEHAQSVYWVGYIAYRRGQAEAAQSSFLKYRELAQQLVKIDPSNADWRLETGYAAQNLGVVQLDRELPRDALESFVEARDAFSGLLGKKPELAIELADADGWVAEAYEAVGDYAAAIKAQQLRLAVLRSLSDPNNDTRARRNAANAHFALAQLELFLGDAPSAENDARESTEMAGALAATDRTNLDSLSEYCFNRLRLAEVQLALMQSDAAKALVDQVSVDADRLTSSDASMLRWQVGIKGLVLALNFELSRTAQRARPLREVDDFLAKVARLEAAGTKLDAHGTRIVALLELESGDARESNAERQEATDRWNHAAARLQLPSESGEFPALTLLARLRLRLGDAPAAHALAARIRASSYRDRAYSVLVRELTRAAASGRVQPTAAN